MSQKTTGEQQPSTSFIAAQADYQGRIIFGDHCIVHPKCQIIAEAGDITFGDYCIVEEKCKIINRLRKDEQGKPIRRDMKIGRYNFFEVGSAVDSSDVGDMNEFQFKSIVSEGSKVESFCQITAGVTVPKNTQIQNYSVVYEDGGKVKLNEEFNEDQRKMTMKELC